MSFFYLLHSYIGICLKKMHKYSVQTFLICQIQQKKYKAVTELD